MKRTIALLAGIITALCIPSARGGSVFSSRGLGQPSLFPDARSMGMGGVCIAGSGPLSISRINPAGLSRLTSTTLSLHYFFESNRYSDETASNTSIYSNFDGFHFVLPFAHGVGFSAGLAPLTRMDYYLSFRESLSGEPYTKSVEGSGGLNTFTFSLFWAIRPWIAIGFSGHYVFGKIVEEWTVDYDDDAFYRAYDMFSTKNWGYGFTGGILVRPVSSLEIGAVYSPDYQIDNRTDVYQSFATKSVRSQGSIRFPGSWGVGSSWKASKILLLAADFQYYEWQRLKINGISPSSMQNSFRAAAGAEFFSLRLPEVPYIQRMAYRVGFAYLPYCCLDAMGKTIGEYWLALGFGFPLVSDTMLDLAFQMARRGSVEAHHLEDTLFRIEVSITGAEKWYGRQ